MVDNHKRQRKEIEYEMYAKPYDKTAESDTTDCWIWTTLDLQYNIYKYIYK